jgi:hypothetical protein
MDTPSGGVLRPSFRRQPFLNVLGCSTSIPPGRSPHEIILISDGLDGRRSASELHQVVEAGDLIRAVAGVCRTPAADGCAVDPALWLLAGIGFRCPILSGGAITRVPL